MVREREHTGLTCTHVGHDYTDEELEFLRAMDRYQTEHHCRFPTYRDVLRVIRSLGYRQARRQTDLQGESV